MMRKLFLQDWGWKCFSLFLAACIWFTVHRIIEPDGIPLLGRPNVLTYDNLAVRLVSSSSDVHRFHAFPPSVQVTLSGPPDVMDQLQANQIRAFVDLTAGTAGSQMVGIVAPANVTLVRVDPPLVSIQLPAKP